MPSLFELALAYTKAGISIIPILPNEAMAPNGSDKTPFDCREYIRHRIATPEELREWFAGDGQFGLAAVHGPISGGLECLDLTYAAVVKLFRQLVIFQGGAEFAGKTSHRASRLLRAGPAYIIAVPILSEGTVATGPV